MPATPDLPLPALLSQVLVAFTVEFDNEFEHRMPHRTTRHGSMGRRQGLWLVSMAMWSNCMRFVGDDGVQVRELEELARTKTNWNGMERWGYIMVAPDPADPRPKPPRSAWIVRATPKGRQAREVWQPVFGVIEARWEERFGKKEIERLRKLLRGLTEKIDLELPDCLPILKYGLFSSRPDRTRSARGARKESPAEPLNLPALLSRALLAFAIEFERQSDVSLAIAANVLRVLTDPGVRARDLPGLSGVSKEAIAMAMGILRKRRLAVIETDNARTKIVRLTSKGLESQAAYRRLAGEIEANWKGRFGSGIVTGLRTTLERLVGDATAAHSPLFPGLEPYPDGWRAAVRKPDMLPHYPMVLHRGGFPDGS